MLSANSKSRISINIIGKVYKTGFRFLSMAKAYEMNVTGFVKYNPDHSVYIEAEGDSVDIQNFILWCKKGPAGSKVENIEVSDIEPKNSISFELL